MNETREPLSYTTPDQAAEQWLPAWFVPRMMQGNGGLALWLSNGVNLPLERIDRVHRASDGSVWLDVTLSLPAAGGKAPAISGAQASINAAHVIAAVETGQYDARSAWDHTWLEVSGRMRMPR